MKLNASVVIDNFSSKASTFLVAVAAALSDFPPKMRDPILFRLVNSLVGAKRTNLVYEAAVTLTMPTSQAGREVAHAEFCQVMRAFAPEVKVIDDFNELQHLLVAVYVAKGAAPILGSYALVLGLNDRVLVDGGKVFGMLPEVPLLSGSSPSGIAHFATRVRNILHDHFLQRRMKINTALGFVPARMPEPKPEAVWINESHTIDALCYLFTGLREQDAEQPGTPWKAYEGCGTPRANKGWEYRVVADRLQVQYPGKRYDYLYHEDHAAVHVCHRPPYTENLSVIVVGKNGAPQCFHNVKPLHAYVLADLICLLLSHRKGNTVIPSCDATSYSSMASVAHNVRRNALQRRYTTPVGVAELPFFASGASLPQVFQAAYLAFGADPKMFVIDRLTNRKYKLSERCPIAPRFEVQQNGEDFNLKALPDYPGGASGVNILAQAEGRQQREGDSLKKVAEGVINKNFVEVTAALARFDVAQNLKKLAQEHAKEAASSPLTRTGYDTLNVHRMASFDKAFAPAIDWMAKNTNPHDVATVDSNSARLYSGELAIVNPFAKD
jgi:hypothetical protein